MQTEAIQRNQDLSLDVQENLPRVTLDEDRIQQVVFNLLDNAMKFTSAGGSICLSARMEISHLVVEVADTGRGITRREQKWLFQPYYHGRQRTEQTGLGLGLPLCKMLVEMHGGQIWFESKKGKGSTFSFSVPLSNNSKK